MSRKECALYWHTVNSICCLLLLLWFIEVKWNWICSTDGKLDFSVIFVIQLYLCCILYILCNHFYLILKTLYMEIFISCNFTCQLWSNVSNSWPVIVYLTKDCCVMEMKISYQKKSDCVFLSVEFKNVSCLSVYLLLKCTMMRTAGVYSLQIYWPSTMSYIGNSGIFLQRTWN